MAGKQHKRHEVQQPPAGASYRIIALTKGKNAIVDALDYPVLSRMAWSAHYNKAGKTWIARHTFPRDENGKKKSVYMHRFILGLGPGQECDHRDHDTLNNRRRNLRECLRGQNVSNSSRKNKLGFRGVSRALSGRYFSQITCDGQQYHLGMTKTAEESARRYDAKARDLFGEFATLNFPV